MAVWERWQHMAATKTRQQGLKALAWLGLALAAWGLAIACSPLGSAPSAPAGSPVGDRAQKTSQKTEIRFWTMQLQPKFTDYFNTLIARFEAQNPQIQVRWLDIPWAAMESKILTAVAARTAPDVANLNPTFAARLAARGAWLNLGDRLDATQRQTYLPNIWQASTLEGQSFGLPWYLTSRVTVYNREMLQAAGLTQPPTTYTELATAAAQIRQKTGKYAFFVTFLPNDSGEVLESLVQMGATLLDDRGRAAFDSPEGRSAFGYWVKLYQAGLIPRESLTQGHRKAIELYQAGETAILATGPEFLATIATNAPSIARASATAPQISGSTGKTSVAVMNLTIPKKTRHPEAALKFALFVTNSENQLAFAQAANVLPSTRQSLTQYAAGLNQPGPDGPQVAAARRQAAAQMAQAQVLLPAVKDIKDLQAIVYEALQAAMLGEKTVDQAVREAAIEWNALRSQ